MLLNLRQIEGGVDLVTLRTEFTALQQSVTSALNNQSERMSVIEANQHYVVEHINVPSSATTANPMTTITLTGVPSTLPVELFINTSYFVEGIGAFTVDRTADPVTITWTFTAASNGFDITHDEVDEIIVRYRTNPANAVVSSVVAVYHSDSIPTQGTFNVGDMVYRIHPISASNLGWICSTAGTGTNAVWLPFGIVDFENIMTVTDDSVIIN